ncbi:hypothetical protein GM160_05455 [Guyparkeria halophila]|uniref:Chorismatase FkbO/Hyg5-like N-terminal domain-containing protein n=1 Tax=Guyparkeria halophila TaxID=47960 RepID=A0A6I6D2K6_9GAMM|nr:hypothetical protein [Guyparkeria halophila]QGT78387.1 hypothetical protein GM160_05455 [Guyparkeria halophila]
MGELPLQWLAGTSGDVAEGFSLDQGVETTTRVGYCLATSPGFSFGVIELDEQTGLADGTERAYRRLFDLLEASDTPHLWRVWQYLPAINADDPETGVERYRLFNQGRAAAFSATGRDVATSAPAACALGCDEAGAGRLIFLAANIPATPIENPRQVSAYHYPPTYGAKSPIFARAAVARGPVHDWLFISGTASITGHATRHVGDIHAQLDETLANLEAVQREANAERPADTAEFDFDANALIRVYLRHPQDLESARKRLENWLNGSSQIQFLRADICRADLLVEIEATLRQPRGSGVVERAPWIPL